MSSDKGYILVDFDRTLAHYESWDKQGKELGPPIRAMIQRVKRWLESGQEVRIFTARAWQENPVRDAEIEAIQTWCRMHLGRELRVQNWKCFRTLAIWDDLAVTVEANTGWRWSASMDHKDPLTYEEEMYHTGYAHEDEPVDPEDPGNSGSIH